MSPVPTRDQIEGGGRIGHEDPAFVWDEGSDQDSFYGAGDLGRTAPVCPESLLISLPFPLKSPLLNNRLYSLSLAQSPPMLFSKNLENLRKPYKPRHAGITKAKRSNVFQFKKSQWAKMFIGLVCNRENMETSQISIHRKWINKWLIKAYQYGILCTDSKEKVDLYGLTWKDLQGRLVREEEDLSMQHEWFQSSFLCNYTWRHIDPCIKVHKERSSTTLCNKNIT